MRLSVVGHFMLFASLVSFCPNPFAQENSDLNPAETEIPLNEPLTSRPKLVKRLKKPPTKPNSRTASQATAINAQQGGLTPPPTPTPPERAAIPVPSSSLRLLRDSRNYGALQGTFQFPSVAQFSLATSIFLKSTTSSRSEGDFSDMSLALYIFSPHLFKIGLIGLYTDASGTANNTIRGGIYGAFTIKSNWIAGLLAPMYFPAAEETNNGRFHALWSFKIFNFLLFSGSYTYIIAQQVNTSSGRPQIGIEIAKGLRLITVYDFNTALTSNAEGFQPGLEFQSSF